MVTAVESGLSDDHQEALDKVEWLISQGASTTQKCTGGSWSLYDEDEGEFNFTVERKGLSAIAYVKAWRAKLYEKNPWPDTYNFLGQVFTTFARTPSSSRNYGAKVPINEGIAELWEKYLSAKDAHDLTIETGDGKVTAHAQMLKEASPVVRAMLESPMKEGLAQRIEVKDTSSSAVSLFLEFLGDPN